MKKLMGGAALALLLATGVANAASTTLYYDNITNTTSGFNSTNQLHTEVDVNQQGQVTFQFFNDAGFFQDGSITGIYFSDLGHLFGTSVNQSLISDSGPGVDFSWGATPQALPGSNNAVPQFQTTLQLTADSNNPGNVNNGVNLAGEWVTLALNLVGGSTFSDVLAALGDGALRIGLKVQQIAGGSDSFVSNPPAPVPLPASALLFGTAIVAAAGLKLRRRRTA